MATTIQAVKSAFFTVLKSGSPGAAVRAALGAGASSVITRTALKQTPLPAAPFAVIQYGAAPGARFQPRTLFATWWLYDDAQREWKRLNELAPLIEAAYPEDAIALCFTDFNPGTDAEITDSTLQRPALAMRFTVKWRS